MKSDFFSFHLCRLSAIDSAREMYLPSKVEGLLHSESMVSMKLGAPVLNPARYGLTQFVHFARWENESSLDEFLKTTPLRDGWHVRLRFYRRWGYISELNDLPENSLNPNPDQPVAGITLARLKLSETLRFLQWGKPVERLVRDHPGKTFAMASMRPLNTLSTFSIWKSEHDLVQMVKGINEHGHAIREQMRKSFHHEFTTMRFYLLSEHGSRPQT